MHRVMETFRNALTFLTIMPAPAFSKAIAPARIQPPSSPAQAISNSGGDTLVFFPVIGALLGLVLAILAAGLLSCFSMSLAGPALLAGLLITLSWALLTGGLHLDGVADTCDGVFSSRSRERTLDIMKDSRIGTMGAIGLFGVLAGKSVALSSLVNPIPSLMAACVLGRWAMALAATTSRYARAEGGMGADFIRPHPTRLALASLWLTPALFLHAPLTFGVALIAVAAFTLIARLILYAKLGGLTGDCLGAICEASEFLVLVVYVIFSR